MRRWDYGYQTTAMANRTVIVDNNTWNNTHIATVGRAMASPEEQAWQIYRSLDVNYVFVVFGGFIGCDFGRPTEQPPPRYFVSPATGLKTPFTP